MEVWKIALNFIWAIMVGVSLGLAVKNYYDLKLFRRVLSKMMDEFDRMMIKEKARELADNITELIFGEDKPEDLEKAIAEVAKDKGCELVAVKKGKRGTTVEIKEERVSKKTTKKATKKADKKEKK